MARFRYAGTNWEGRLWGASLGLKALLVEVETVWPTRHPADGTVAGAGHDANSPASDHRPRPLDATVGIVRAGDVGEVAPGDCDRLAELLRTGRDPRVKYVIHNDRMFSSYPTRTGPAWTWRDYGGTNPHISHLHISVTDGADDDPRPWGITPAPPAPPPDPGEEDMSPETFARQLQAVDVTALCLAKTASGRYVINPRNTSDRQGEVTYWVTKLTNRRDPDWEKFQVAVQVAALIDAAAG